MKRYIHIMATFFVCQSVASLASAILTGNVKSENGEPLQGANVYLKNTYDGATTDAEGTFTFKSFQNFCGLITSVLPGSFYMFPDPHPAFYQTLNNKRIPIAL